MKNWQIACFSEAIKSFINHQLTSSFLRIATIHIMHIGVFKVSLLRVHEQLLYPESTPSSQTFFVTQLFHLRVHSLYPTLHWIYIKNISFAKVIFKWPCVLLDVPIWNQANPLMGSGSKLMVLNLIAWTTITPILATPGISGMSPTSASWSKKPLQDNLHTLLSVATLFPGVY